MLPLRHIPKRPLRKPPTLISIRPMPDLSPRRALEVPVAAPSSPQQPSPAVRGALSRLGVGITQMTSSERGQRISLLLERLATENAVPANEMHVVLDGLLGTPVGVLAQQYKLPLSEVEHALSHPLVLLLQRELAAAQAEGLADPMKRIEQAANEMLDVKLDLVRDVSTHPRLRNEIASDILDRGGMRKPARVQTDITHRIVIDATVAARLSDTIRELEVAANFISYKQHLLSPIAPAADELTLAPGLEQPEESLSASPGTSDAGARANEVAA